MHRFLVTAALVGLLGFGSVSLVGPKAAAESLLQNEEISAAAKRGTKAGYSSDVILTEKAKKKKSKAKKKKL